MRKILVTALILLSSRVLAEPVQLQNVRIWAAPDNTRIVFDVSGPVDHRLEMLSDPYRAVIDISNARLLKAPAQPAASEPGGPQNIARGGLQSAYPHHPLSG